MTDSMSSKLPNQPHTGNDSRSCEVCGDVGADRHHIRTRKSGGSDDEFNLINLCRKHHSELHYIGTTTFCEKYPRAMEVVLSKGWEFVNRKLRRK